MTQSTDQNTHWDSVDHPRLRVTVSAPPLEKDQVYTEDELYACLNEMINKWTPSDESFSDWVRTRFGFSKSEDIDRLHLQERFKMESLPMVILYQHMLHNKMINDETVLGYQNNSIMGRLLESISHAYQSLDSELRCKSAMLDNSHRYTAEEAMTGWIIPTSDRDIYGSLVKGSSLPEGTIYAHDM